MLLKHIICKVKPDYRLDFSEAQKSWAKTTESKGFLCQIGGWNHSQPNEAVILSFWKDRLSLDGFMNKMHDDIFYQNNQLETYENIMISFFECDNYDFDKQFFIDKIDFMEYLITTNTSEDTSLKIDFLNGTILIQAKNIENNKVSLIESWKVI